jgi:phenylacetate-coenzyme A ligase PaaK-like adenylate-forming protein
VQRLNDWQPQLLAVYPSVLLPLADAQLAGRLHIAPLHIGTSAERLPAETRRRVALAFPAAQLRDTYGATEYAPIATECSEGRLHLLEDRAIIEVVDGRGRAVPPGEAGERVLLTVLDRHTQPLIRYELSDGVRERPGRCACGRPFRMLEGIEGRVEETLSFAAASGGGAAVAIHPNAIHALLERVPASGWQVVQGAAGELTVYLSGTPRVGIAEALRGGLLEMLRLRGAVPPPVEVRWSEALQRGASGKAPLIAAHRAARR